MNYKSKCLPLTIHFVLAFAIVVTAIFASTVWSAGSAATDTVEKQPANQSSNLNLPALRDDEAVEHLKRHGLYASLGEAIMAARYRVEWRDGGDANPYNLPHGAFVANNPANDWQAFFTDDGLRLSGRSKDDEWQTVWRLRSIGYGNELQTVAGNSEKTAEGNRFTYKHQLQAITPSSKHYTFAPANQFVSVTENVTGIVFISILQDEMKVTANTGSFIMGRRQNK